MRELCMASGCGLCDVLEPASGWSPPARTPLDAALEARLDGSPLSRSVSMLPRRLRFWFEGAAVPDAEVPVPPSSPSSEWALCLLPRTCAGGMDEGGGAASREPDAAGTERLEADDVGFGFGFWACRGGSCGGTGGWAEGALCKDSNGGWVGRLSESDGIWIEAWLGGWSATAIEFGFCGTQVPAEDSEGSCEGRGRGPQIKAIECSGVGNRAAESTEYTLGRLVEAGGAS